MPINSNVRTPYQIAEYGKFVELVNDTQYPPVSVTRWSYPDTSDAFPNNSDVPPASSVEVFPKYAILTHLTNAEDISISLSAGNLNVNLGDVETILDASKTIQTNILTSSQSNGTTLSRVLTSEQANVTTLASILATNQNNGTLLASISTILNQQLGQSGYDFISGGQTANSGPYTTIQVLSAARISSITTTAGNNGPLTNFELPQGFSFNGPFTSVTLSYGAVFVYRK